MRTEMTATIVGGVTIETIGDGSQSAAAWQTLKDRLRERPIHAGGKRFTRDELHERH